MSVYVFTPLVIKVATLGAIVAPTTVVIIVIAGCVSRRVQRTSHLPGRWNWTATLLSAWLVSTSAILMLLAGGKVVHWSSTFPLFLICGIGTFGMSMAICLRYLRMDCILGSTTSLVVSVWIHSAIWLIFVVDLGYWFFALVVLQPFIAAFLLALAVVIDPPDWEAAKRMVESATPATRSRLRIRRAERRRRLYELAVFNTVVPLLALALNHPALLGHV